jgi:malonyl-CoA/methylmalonyl-CoA synthetase
VYTEFVFHRWKEISGHHLLERYGMTEIGMALSNPLHGPRIPVRENSGVLLIKDYVSNVEFIVQGRVGIPLPKVQVKIHSTDQPSTPSETNVPIIGELLVKGPQVFKEYNFLHIFIE